MKVAILTNVLITLISHVSTISGQKCTQPYRRKEIRELTTEEFNRYVDAVKKLHSMPKEMSKYSKLDHYANLHIDNTKLAHGNPRFLPWHRYFIKLYELDLQKIDPEVHLPYWDWSKDYEDPASSIVMSEQFLGGHGDYKRGDYCVRDGKFANWTVALPAPHCLQRRYLNNTKIPSFASPKLLNAILNFKDFSKFSYDFELKHGEPHDFIGGEYDFHLMHSPNDPIFWLHHTFVDLIWNEWQLRHPNEEPITGSAYNMVMNLNESLGTWDVLIKDTFDIHNDFYCYTYPRYGKGITNTINNSRIMFTPSLKDQLATMDIDEAIKTLEINLAKNNTNLRNSRKLDNNNQNVPISEKWIQMNHLNIQQVREQERKFNKFMELINKFPELK